MKSGIPLAQIVSEHFECKNKAILTATEDTTSAAQACACLRVFICWHHVGSGGSHGLWIAFVYRYCTMSVVIAY